MYYYHMLWFILLSTILSMFFIRKIRQSTSKTPEKQKIYIYIILLLIGLLIGTFIYILKKQFKTSYILIPYEKYFIFLLFILSVANIILLSLFTSNPNFNSNLVHAFCGIVLSFLILCWAILSLPVNLGNRKTETFFTEFNNLLAPYKNIYKLNLPSHPNIKDNLT